MNAALDEAASVDPIYLTTIERQSAMVDLSRVIARAQALLMRVVAASGDVAEATGARSTAAWLAVETRDVHQSSRLAEALGSRWQGVGDAFGPVR